MKVKVEFTGGLESLFNDQKELTLDIAEGSKISDLLLVLKNEYMDKDREELFLQDGIVRPGILVLINDADWELEGEENYELEPRDNVLFASTLHGG
ncbi:similar to Saccharomyces cerevisiae YIL008W URM1 Ubiquitin-like protein involved in thiolation of cytoplasmic tRNAs [Geotrichum candidum]|uniref:Ubiquitin-related modifier 1 n=1 Tax=Geotrichum candidum TaxID=1173061 RepID=A0A0J9X6Y7_GEOCN|nr:similar to Saccharomyces cerevisiae YIL008W URM1 Ubiquitin-like protein involved in thiolation of cytoplasmic tRNAs [Geotrichum candidum]